MAGLYDNTPGLSDGTGLYRGRLGLFSGASGLINGDGAVGPNILPADTVSEIWFGDADAYDYAAARNLRAASTPTGNMFIYTSDQVRTQAGTPTITYNYDGNGGTRVQLTGAQSLTLMTSAPPGNGTLNGQTCTIGMQWMPTGGSTQKIRFGQTPYTAPTVPGTTTSATGGTFAQVSTTGAYSSAASVVITTLANSTISGTLTIAAAPTGAVRAANVTTFTTGTHGRTAGQQVTVAGVTDTSFNGTYTIIATPSTTTFTVSNPGANTTSGGGTVSFSAVRLGNLSTFTTTTVHDLIVGQSVVITGVTDTTFNSQFTVAAVGVPGASRVSNVSTFTTTAANSISAGDVVNIAGVTNATFNGTFTVLASPSPTSTTFAVSNPGANATSGSGTATKQLTVTAVPTTTTFEVSNPGTDGVSASGTVAKPVDIVVKELQMYRGSSLPAYSTENWDYHLKSNWALPDALSMTATGNGLDNVAPAVARGAIVFPARTTYDAITVFIVANKSSLITANSALLTPIYDPDTGAAIGSSEFNMAAAVTTGFFYAAPQSALTESGRIVMQDAGTQIYAFRGSIAQATTYLNELQSMQTELGTGGWPPANTMALARTVADILVPGASRVFATGISTFTTTAAHGMLAGRQVIVSGVTDATFNGTFTVDTVPTLTTFTVLNPGPTTTSGGGTALPVSAARVSGVSTFTTTTAHGMIAGQRAVVSGVTDPTFDGEFTVVAVPTTTTFTVADPGADAVSGLGRVDKPVSLRGFWLGSYAATRNQSPTSSLFDGSYYMFAMVPRALSDAEMLSAMSYIRTEATARSIPLTTLSDITITPGDSLTEWLSAISWPWVLVADATISPRMQLKNCANGGSSFNGIDIGQPEAFGTVLTTEVIPAIQACDAMGTTPIVMLMDGANDYAYLSTLAGAAPPSPTPAGWNTALAGWENYRDIWWIPYMQAVRAASPNVKIIGIDTMPRGDTAATTVDFELNGRGPWNTWKRANAVPAYCDAYVSVAGTTLETFAGADAAGYFSGDKLHLSIAGQAYLASVIKPIWSGAR